MADHAFERTTIDAVPDRLFEILTDFESYPSWARDLKETQVLSRDAEGRGVEVEYRAAAMGRSTRYVLRYDYERAPNGLAWRLARGDIMRRLDGSYEFDGHDDGSTSVTYRLDVELIVPLPGFVKRRAESRIIRTALRELQAVAERA